MGIEAALIGGGAMLGSSIIGGRAASKAAQAGADAQLQSAQIAADAAKFRPYNITTALGGVSFGDQTADINYNPQLAAYRNRLFGLSTGMLPEDIRAAEEEEYRRLLEGSRGALEQQTAQLGTSLFRSGRQGLDIFGANPELKAFAAAQMDRELALRQAAEQQVANRIAQSTGLFTSGVGVEQAMLQPLEIGAQLGGRSAAAGAAQADALLRGGLSAAQMRTQGSLVGPSLFANNLSNLGNQYMQQQQQQQLFNQMMMARSPSIYGSSNVYGPYGSGTVPVLNPNANVYDI